MTLQLAPRFSVVSCRCIPIRVSARVERKIKEDIARAMARHVDEYFIYGGMSESEFVRFHETRRAWNNRWYLPR